MSTRPSATGVLVLELLVAAALAAPVKQTARSTGTTVLTAPRSAPVESKLWGPNGGFGDWTPDDEVVAYRSERSKTFNNHDGTFSTMICGPLHRLDAAGSWVDLPESEILAQTFERRAPEVKGETDAQVIVGTGTSSSSYMWYIYYNYYRCQYLYLASELGALNAGGRITEVAFYADGGTPPDQLNSSEHWLNDVSYTQFATADWETPGTLVWSGNLSRTISADWSPLTLQTQFIHAAGQNLLFSHRHQDGDWESSIYYRYTTATNRGKYGYSDFDNPPTMSMRPGYANIRITYFPLIPNDVGVSAIRTPSSAGVPKDTTFYPTVRITNYGTSSQSNIPVYCWIDSAGVRRYDRNTSYAGPLNPGDTAIVQFAFSFTTSPDAGITYNMTTFTNLGTDGDRSNDTMKLNFTTVASYNPVYQQMWQFSARHATPIGVTSVQDTLLWVSSAGLTSSLDPNWFLIFDARSHAFLDSFAQYNTAEWGNLDLCYDPVDNAVYAGNHPSSTVHKINATSRALVGTITVTGSSVPTWTNGMAYDGDSLYSCYWNYVGIAKFATSGTNCHTVVPAITLDGLGLGWDGLGGKMYLSESPGDEAAKVAQYDVNAGLLLGDTLLPEFGGSMALGGCELWRGDSFLLVVDQELSNVHCFRLYQLAADVGAAGFSHYPYTAVEGQSHTMSIRIRNYGTATQTSIPVFYDDGLTRVSETWTGSLLPDSVASHTFATQWTPSDDGEVPVVFGTELVGDLEPSNDSIIAPVAVFIGGTKAGQLLNAVQFPPPGWTSQILGGLYDWTRVASGWDPTCLPLEGAGMAMYESWSASAGSEARMVTHGFDVQAESVFVRFFMYGDPGYASSNDRVLVQYSTDSVTFTTVGSFSRYNPVSSWYQKNLGFRVTPPQRLWVGFLAHSEWGNNMFVDSIRVYAPSKGDVGVTAILAPVGRVDTNEVITPTATWRNFHTRAANFAGCFALIDPSLTRVYNQQISVSGLGAGAETTLYFPTYNVGMNEGDWIARCSTSAAGDTNPANDVRQQGFKVMSRPEWPVGWHEAKSLPAGTLVKDGGWLAFNEGDGRIYACKGNKSGEFFCYSPLDDSWTTLASIPNGVEGKPPKKGCDGISDGDNFVYATKGNNTFGFWRYNVADDSWEQWPDVPPGPRRKKVKGGTGLAFVPPTTDDTVGCAYLLKGGTTEFYQFNTATRSWIPLTDAPAGAKPKYSDGSWLLWDEALKVYGHKGKYSEMYTYSLDSSAWNATNLGGIPPGTRNKKPKHGSAGAWYDGAIYALKGGNTCEFWQYTASGDTGAGIWAEKDTMPQVGSTGKKKRVKGGGDIVSYGAGVFFAMKGNKTLELWRYVLPLYALRSTPYARQGVMAERIGAAGFGFAITPNPLVGGFASLRYSLPKAGLMEVGIYDITGRCVHSRSLVHPATGSLALDLRSLSAGVYLVRFDADGFTATRKLVVQR